MVKYAPRKVYIRESGGYVELSYTEFCRCRESDQTYMDKLFIPIQGCLLEVVREQYTDFKNSLLLGSTFSPPFSLESWWCFPPFRGAIRRFSKTPKIF